MRCTHFCLYRSMGPFVALFASVAVIGCVDSASSVLGDRADTAHTSLVEPDFTLTVLPASATIVPGQSASFSVFTRALNGSSQSITLDVSGLPSGVTGVFNPPSVIAGGVAATLTMSASVTASGTATFAVTGTSGTTSHTANASLTVQPITSLTNGVTVTNLSGRFRQRQDFSIAVPASQEVLLVTLGKSSSGFGNLDFYVRAGAPPTSETFDCSRFFVGTDETCEFVNPAENTYFVMISGASTQYTGITLAAMFGPDPTPVLENNVPVTNLSGNSGPPKFFKMVVPPGQSQVTFALSGGFGIANLYVRAGVKPDLSTFDCTSSGASNNATCVISNPVAGNYFVMIKGSTIYAGVTLVGHFP